MTRNIVNIGQYKYLVEYFDSNFDNLDNQYYAEFVMLRNFTIMNNIIYDNDIYIIERKYFDEYINELHNNGKDYGNILAFPITNLKVNSYSNSYKKFNDIFNIFNDNLNEALFSIDSDNNVNYSSNVYKLYNIVSEINNDLSVNGLLK